jgi:hypothetical protein
VARDLTSARRGAAPGAARQIVVFLHGYGADGADLLGLAEPLAPHLPDTAFFAPDAPEPCAAAPMGRQWFPIPWIDGSSEAAAAEGLERAAADLDAWLDGLLAGEGLGPDRLAPQNHDRMAAEILRPFVREEVAWVVEHHGLFQTHYYGHHFGWDRDARDRFRDHPCWQSCADFCERWDQASFDPDYPTDPLDSFAGDVAAVFARTAYDPDVIRAGEVLGLPPAR